MKQAGKAGTQTGLAILIAISVLFNAALTAQEDQSDPKLESAATELSEAIKSYVAAFNSQDVETLASHWSPDGVYISNISDRRVEGRDAVVAGLKELFAGKTESKLDLQTDSIEFISPNVALEKGFATVTNEDGTTQVTAYRGIYMKQNGKWLIDRMTEEESPTTLDDGPSQRLKELEWLVGDWADQAGDETIQFECDWTEGQNYISRKFTVSIAGQVDSSGLQIIGWDPRKERILSWLFDSNGGFVEGTWTKKDDRWFVQSIGRFPDGASGSFTSIFRPVDQDSYGWQKINRQVEGKIMPNIDEIIVTRK